jgi:cytochrome c553
MKRWCPAAAKVGILTLCLVSSVTAHGRAEAAGDVKAGRDKATKCEACHGLDGHAKIVEAPNLAGQNEQYMVVQLEAFKSGQRKNEMMAVVGPTLSQQDIEDLAAYYSAIEIVIKKLPGE